MKIYYEPCKRNLSICLKEKKIDLTHLLSDLRKLLGKKAQSIQYSGRENQDQFWREKITMGNSLHQTRNRDRDRDRNRDRNPDQKKTEDEHEQIPLNPG